ncbi:MAG: glutathione S-transferase domain-containing protein [Halieaceae bacterium]|jgi:glutathione S-transferase|nr:glutathione S-transferase domain-containing protein [Halieaceae bacterium]
MPPRPNIDPLSGGYRRIPIAQIGADIVCDSRLISAEIAHQSGKLALDPAAGTSALQDYARRLEGDVFWAAVLSMSPGTTIRQLVRSVGVWNTLRFIKDRAGVGRSARVQLPSAKQARAAFAAHLEELEQRLEGDFLAGSTPSHLDFAAFHTLWFQQVVGGARPPAGLHRVADWYRRMSAFGHGREVIISREDAFAAARDNAPRPVPPDHALDELIGTAVSVSPDDYALDATRGTLVGSSQERWIVARETTDFGLLHVHFPRAGFELRVQANG